MNRLDELLLFQDISIKELANRLKITLSCVYRWLRGDNLPNVEYAVKLADLFGCSLDYFLARSEEYGSGEYKAGVSFGTRFGEVLKEKQLSVYKLAKDKIINQSQAYLWIKKEKMPSVSTILKLADYLGVSVDYLLGRE